MRTLESFIADNNITAVAEATAPDPEWHGRDGGTSWNVTLVMADGGTMVVPFHQGSAHTEPPTAQDVMSCIAMDASGYENARQDFGDWAEEYGFESPREAWRIWQATEKQSQSLRLFVGAEEYDALLWETHHDPSESDDEQER